MKQKLNLSLKSLSDFTVACSFIQFEIETGDPGKQCMPANVNKKDTI